MEDKREPDPYPVKIDVRSVLSSPDLEDRHDRFLLKFVPDFFTWLGWVFILGGLQFLASKTPFWPLGAINWLSWGLVYIYFSAYFRRLNFYNIPGLKSGWVLSFAVSFPLTVTFVLGSWKVAKAIADLQSAAN